MAVSRGLAGLPSRSGSAVGRRRSARALAGTVGEQAEGVLARRGRRRRPPGTGRRPGGRPGPPQQPRPMPALVGGHRAPDVVAELRAARPAPRPSRRRDVAVPDGRRRQVGGVDRAWVERSLVGGQRVRSVMWGPSAGARPSVEPPAGWRPSRAGATASSCGRAASSRRRPAGRGGSRRAASTCASTDRRLDPPGQPGVAERVRPAARDRGAPRRPLVPHAASGRVRGPGPSSARSISVGRLGSASGRDTGLRWPAPSTTDSLRLARGLFVAGASAACPGRGDRRRRLAGRLPGARRESPCAHGVSRLRRRCCMSRSTAGATSPARSTPGGGDARCRSWCRHRGRAARSCRRRGREQPVARSSG